MQSANLTYGGGPVLFELFKKETNHGILIDFKVKFFSKRKRQAQMIPLNWKRTFQESLIFASYCYTKNYTIY